MRLILARPWLRLPSPVGRLFHWCLICLSTAGPTSVWQREISAQPPLPERVEFNAHIRPILSDRCFFCHGPDDKKREADLRLDNFEGATRDLGGYAAVVPGNLEASELIARITSTDPDVVMPPPASKKPALQSHEIELLRRWIAQGAEYEGHWAFLPVRRSPAPEVAQADWVRGPIDAFILQRIEQAGLRPSEPADRATLLRRVYLDLIGLLPAPEEVAAFVQDPDPLSYERLVDRLLASPHYGERWGRHWLDQARYADSNGYSIDGDRDMWPFRDWVLRALNDDMPFDQFSKEQLAGDLLPNATKRQIAASAFHRNTLINQEGGVDREQFRNEAVVDRVNTTGAVWLGLTVGCAQCHSHKFDPISHREFYSLFAFFNSGRDVNDRGPVLEIQAGELLHRDGVARSPGDIIREQLATKLAAWERAEIASLEQQLAAPADAQAEWKPVEILKAEGTYGTSFEQLDDGSLLSTGEIKPHDSYLISFQSDLPQLAAVRLRVLTHESLPKQGPGRAGNGNFVLTEVALSIDGKDQSIVWAVADHEQPKFPIQHVLDGDAKTGWAINVGPGSTATMNAPHEAVFALAEPLPAEARAFTLRLEHRVHPDYLIGRLAIDASATAPSAPRPQQEKLLAALKTPAAKRNAEQSELVLAAFANVEPQARQILARPKPVTGQLMVMRELDQPRTTYLLTRGDFTRPDVEQGSLAPGVPAVVAPAFTPPESGQATRLDLARWLVSPENPLTPRVTMNRVWMRYFGKGLVETEEDFGTQGTPPSHPELLDWLASEFVRSGWSLKHMHRLIATSATYRQSSSPRPELLERDPRNILLARQARLRVESEIVRDMALVASGLFHAELGGPSVRPPQPDGVYAFTQTAKPWNAETGANRYRRALYTMYYRSAPYPLFTTFDSPDFQTVCTRRNRSNTPLQSLTVANDPAMLEMAEALAGRVWRELGPQATDEAYVDRTMLLCVNRLPNAVERQLLTGYLQRQRTSFAADEESARQLVSDRLAADLPLPEAAAAVCLARAVLNTDNFITRE